MYIYIYIYILISLSLSPSLVAVLRRARLSILSRGGLDYPSHLSRGGPISRHISSGHPTLNTCQPDNLPFFPAGANVGQSDVAPVALEPGPLDPKSQTLFPEPCNLSSTL